MPYPPTTTIQGKLLDGEYGDPSSFVAECRLIVSNAMRFYSHEQHVVHQDALRLAALMEELLQEAFEGQPTSPSPPPPPSIDVGSGGGSSGGTADDFKPILDLRNEIMRIRKSMYSAESTFLKLAYCTHRQWLAATGVSHHHAYRLAGLIDHPDVTACYEPFVAANVSFHKLQRKPKQGARLVLAVVPGSGRRPEGGRRLIPLVVEKIAARLNADPAFETEVVVAEIERSGSLAIEMKSVGSSTLVPLQALYHAEAFQQLSCKTQISERDYVWLYDDCLGYGPTSAAAAVFLHRGCEVPYKQMLGSIFLATGRSSFPYVDTKALMLLAHPELEALLRAPATPEEASLLDLIKVNEEALRGAGWGKHLGLWSLGPDLGPLLAVRTLLACGSVTSMLDQLKATPKDATALAAVFAAASARQPFKYPSVEDSGLYLHIMRVQGQAQQDLFLRRCELAMTDSMGKLAPLRGAVETAGTAAAIIIPRQGKSKDLVLRGKQISRYQPTSLNQGLARTPPIRTGNLARAAEAAYVHTNATHAGDGCESMMYLLVKRSELEASDIYAGAAADGSPVLWSMIWDETEPGATLAFSLHNAVCGYGTAVSVGGNADGVGVKRLYKPAAGRTKAEARRISALVPDELWPLFDHETVGEYESWMRGVGGYKYAAEVGAFREANYRCRMFLERGDGTKEEWQVLEVALLQAAHALRCVRYTGETSQLMAGKQNRSKKDETADSYNDLERDMRITFEVDSGGERTFWLRDIVYKGQDGTQDPFLTMHGSEATKGDGYVVPGHLLISYNLGSAQHRTHQTINQALEGTDLDTLLRVPGVSSPTRALILLTFMGKTWRRSAVKADGGRYWKNWKKVGTPDDLLGVQRTCSFPRNIFQPEFDKYLGSMSSKRNYLLLVYNHALPKLLDLLPEFLRLRPDIDDVTTYYGMGQAVRGTGLAELMLAKHDTGGVSKVNKFLKFLEEKAGEEKAAAQAQKRKDRAAAAAQQEEETGEQQDEAQAGVAAAAAAAAQQQQAGAGKPASTIPPAKRAKRE